MIVRVSICAQWNDPSIKIEIFVHQFTAGIHENGSLGEKVHSGMNKKCTLILCTTYGPKELFLSNQGWHIKWRFQSQMHIIILAPSYPTGKYKTICTVNFTKPYRA